MELKEILEFIDYEHNRLIAHFRNDDGEPKRIFKYERLAKLMEEVGELSDAILHSDNSQRKEKIPASVEHECADVIITTLLLSKEMDIDIAKALEEKIEKIKNRVY